MSTTYHYGQSNSPAEGPSRSGSYLASRSRGQSAPRLTTMRLSRVSGLSWMGLSASRSRGR
jgi:hypothetical protein